ncbi:MAG: hypothetical protein OQK82_02010 [Candidatus Pacearchaeota archaeon]|nr:hypothetical protein [Candidatus Pacearchaeota archaeon]
MTQITQEMDAHEDYCMEMFLQCHADYYNFGSRRDSFYDTFVTSGVAQTTSSGGRTRHGDGGIISNESKGIFTGFAIAGNETPKIEFKWRDIPFIPENKYQAIATGFMIFVVLSILFLMLRQKRKFSPHFKFSSLRLIFGIIIFLIVLFGIGIFIYDLFIQKFLNSGLMSYSYLQDPLFRGIIFMSFIIIAVIILFKTLNIRMEIKLGEDFHILKNHQDRKTAKLQKKINREILRRELNHVKHRKK